MKRYSLVVFALLFPATLAAQISVTGVTSSPSPPTFADAITFKIEVVAPSNCLLDEEQIEVEALADRLLLTLPYCFDDGSRPVPASLAKLVEHQLPGTYLVEIYPGVPVVPAEPGEVSAPEPVDPPVADPLWSSTLEVIDPPYEIRESDPIVPSLSCDTPNAAGEPCAYQKALVDKLKLGITPDPMVFKWQTQLDWTFNNWRNGGSQNLPVLAQALALVTGTPDPARTKTWWNNFFDCQLGQTCPVANPGTLVYFSGGEILSNTYNEHTLLAAMVVNYWTTRTATRDLPLANKARRFLRSAWYLFTLAAGNGPARSYFENGGSIATNCQWAPVNNRYSYNGPFLALAGGRSKPTEGCLDDRAPLFATATRWSGFTRSGENREQKDLRQFLEINFVSEGSAGETVFALDPTLREDPRSGFAESLPLASHADELDQRACAFEPRGAIPWLERRYPRKRSRRESEYLQHLFERHLHSNRRSLRNEIRPSKPRGGKLPISLERRNSERIDPRLRQTAAFPFISYPDRGFEPNPRRPSVQLPAASGCAVLAADLGPSFPRIGRPDGRVLHKLPLGGPGDERELEAPLLGDATGRFAPGLTGANAAPSSGLSSLRSRAAQTRVGPNGTDLSRRSGDRVVHSCEPLRLQG